MVDLKLTLQMQLKNGTAINFCIFFFEIKANQISAMNKLGLPAQLSNASSLDENDDQNSEFERSFSVVWFKI